LLHFRTKLCANGRQTKGGHSFTGEKKKIAREHSLFQSGQNTEWNPQRKRRALSNKKERIIEALLLIEPRWGGIRDENRQTGGNLKAGEMLSGGKKPLLMTLKKKTAMSVQKGGGKKRGRRAGGRS